MLPQRHKRFQQAQWHGGQRGGGGGFQFRYSNVKGGRWDHLRGRWSGKKPAINTNRMKAHTNGTHGKSQFKPNVDPTNLTKTAWERGKPIFDGNGKFIGKRYTFKNPIGTSPSGCDQYSIFVHWGPKSGIHGVPTTRGE